MACLPAATTHPTLQVSSRACRNHATSLQVLPRHEDAFAMLSMGAHSVSWSAPCSTLTVLASANMGPSAAPATSVLHQMSAAAAACKPWLDTDLSVMTYNTVASRPSDALFKRPLIDSPTEAQQVRCGRFCTAHATGVLATVIAHLCATAAPGHRRQSPRPASTAASGTRSPAHTRKPPSRP